MNYIRIIYLVFLLFYVALNIKIKKFHLLFHRAFAEELDKHQDRAIKKWGFDFRNGSPLTTNAQYVWERISYQESNRAPAVYTLTRAAHVRPAPVVPSNVDLLMDERAERENYMINTSTSTDTDSCGDYDSQDESLVFKVPETVHCSSNKRAHVDSAANRSPLRKRQPKITGKHSLSTIQTYW